MNGYQVAEKIEDDIYTIKVPVEETELLADTDSQDGEGGGTGTLHFKYVLSERDYFDSN